MSNEELLKKTYYDPESGYVGEKKLYEKLKDQGVTQKEVKNFLKKQKINQVNKKHKSGSFIPQYPLHEFQIDLIYLENKHLNQASYGLCCVDAFTKVANVKLIKKKDEKEVTKAMTEILEDFGNPESIYCDEGTEFNNKLFKQLCEDRNIELILTLKHAPMVERFNRTFKELLSKYMQSTKSKTIAVVLPKILYNYNTSFHSSIGMSPEQATDENNYATVYKNLSKDAKVMNRPNISIGDTVRYLIKEKSFEKRYNPRWSKTTHEVIDKVGRQFVLNGVDRTYLSSYLQKIDGEVDDPEVEPDYEGSSEQKLREMNKNKVIDQNIKLDLNETIAKTKQKREIKKPKKLDL
jgi:hypothetical protein